MKAEPAVQLRLLELQALDSGIDRLAARRRTLPELEVITARSADLASISDDLIGVRTELGDVTRAQRRLEDEIELVRSRSARDTDRLGSGAISNARELENLQSEVASLARRQGVLEDEALERMEAVEALDGRIADLERREADVRAELDAANTARDKACGEIDAETVRLRDRRGALAPSLPDALVTLYERIRSTSGGVGAAALLRRRCQGCHLELSGGDLREVAAAPADEVVRCEECQRILIRTAESGL
ncbi:C4-type zinc ribbon domain-containing protein [Frankia sp. AgPm24]|uniref:zinc ribbon domain-containing protein n=1 Tax=Frankia sp. AgPm24 TaxID=631128 RepID=UPI00200BFC06|nr:C4-type zinc ribbon domain-containing protein [Frankia sp. AgPm24]MCK9922397.1 C4-type zinc ribbon domain-containing protein [Frankia sp. AgPm24]